MAIGPLAGCKMLGKTMRVVVCLSCAVLLLGFPLFSQINTGRLLGTVTDQTGGVIAGAMVTVTNPQTGVARNLVADDAGEYNAPNLTPGTYTVKVTANGFQTFERQNIALGVGQDARIDAQLTPGQVTQTITVSEAAPLLDTTSATVTGTINTENIADIPLNGRNYQNLLQLRPGVTIKPGGGTLTTSTNGLRPEDNNYYVEGLDNDEPFTGQSIINSTLPVGDAATFVPIDAIQEVNVQTNSPAEFGKRPGAVINVGLKSGTNTIHGTAFAFGRSDKFDSAEYAFPGPAPKPAADLEQWGGTVGGPIKKDKLFYFGAFERQTYSVAGNYPVVSPTSVDLGNSPQAIAQSIPSAERDLGNHGIPLNALSLKLLPLFGTNNTNSSAQNYGFPNVVSIYNVLGKIDYHLSDHHTIAGSYFLGNGTTIAESITSPGLTQPQFRDNAKLRAQFVTTSWTWTPNSTWVNDLRFGWNQHQRIDHVDDINTPLSTYGINTGVTDPLLGGFPTIQLGNDFSQLGGDQNLPKDYGPSKDYDVVDHVSFLRGKHAFKFGMETLFIRPYLGNHTGGRGVFTFSGGNAFSGSSELEDLLAGAADGSNGGTVLNGNPLRHLRQEDYSGFFEDTWHVLPHVTLNYGLRYEYFTVMRDANNLIGNWDPTVGFEQVGVNINSAYNGYHKDFSPRLGIAWDIGGKGKTVVRAGGGVYYVDLVAAALVDQTQIPGKSSGLTAIPTAYSTGKDGSAAPLNPLANGGIGTASLGFSGSQLNWSTTGQIFPAGQIGSSSGFSCGDGLNGHPGPCNVTAIDKNVVPPRVVTWTLGIQRTLTNNFTLEVNYIGDHSNNLIGVQDLNAFNPQSPGELAFLPCGKKGAIQNHCELQSDRPFYGQFPYLQYINWLSNIDRSNFHALQTTLTARAYHGLGFVGAYTYSHALDDYSTARGIHTPQNNLQPNLDYGASDFDQRHHFSFTLNYAIPGKKGYGQMLEGWAVNSAVLIQSGLPWSPTDTSDNISKDGDKKSDRWDFFGNPSDFKGGKYYIPFYAGGSANMPALCTQDAASVGATANLAKFGCFMQGNSVLIAPPTGTYGTAARNLFRDDGFRDWDFSLFKNWTVKERLTAQFRVEVFNILNHSILATPPNSGLKQGQIGSALQTPDSAGQNPLLGTGGSRAMQLGLKLLF
jgi:carboxypeptidase family protein/TonB-dependent receptor-like protein